MTDHWSVGVNDEIWNHDGPCLAAVEWMATERTPQEAWRKCQHSSWMTWLLDALEYPRPERQVRCCCGNPRCTNNAYWSADDIRQWIPEFPL